MRIAELAKPRDEWCPHCIPGSGCKIYPSRPASCAGFVCAWLIGEGLPEAMRPDLSHVVIQPPNAGAAVAFHVDPEHPLAWREPLFLGLAWFILQHQERIALVIGDERLALLVANGQLLKGQAVVQADGTYGTAGPYEALPIYDTMFAQSA
jgi:hypothetical protein